MSSDKKDPAFLWYCTAWLQSENVRAMTLEQRGAYADLLSFGWLHGSIPECPTKLRGLLGGISEEHFATIWSALGACWSPMPGNPGRLINQRQEHERATRKAKAEEMRARGQAGGKRGAEQRASGSPSTRQPEPQPGRPPGGQPEGQAEAQAESKPSTSTSNEAREIASLGTSVLSDSDARARSAASVVNGVAAVRRVRA